MNISNRTILFIDDTYGTLLENLNIQANEKGYTLYPAETVKEGLDILESNGALIDAVILDLVFPQNEMQGLDALKLIKQKYEYLPVIMLTGSDSADDIRIVVQCMQAGAYNYVGKTTLDTAELFQLIDNAINKNRNANYIPYAGITHKEDLPLITVVEDYNIGRINKRALFGFELYSVIRPNDEKEDVYFKQKALEWHYSLLKTLSVSYNESIQLNLKFFVLGKNFKCRIIFSLFAEDDDDLQKWLVNIKQDITVFFNNNENSKTNPYLFEIITDTNILKQAVEYKPYDGYQYIMFYREPLSVQNRKSTGYATISDSTGDQQPNVIFPEPPPLVLDNKLYTFLPKDQNTEIDVQLIPSRLTINENELLKRVVKEKSLTRTDGRQLNEQQDYKFIEDFTGINNRFLISVMLKCRKSFSYGSLKTSISEYFFGGGRVLLSAKDPESLNRYEAITGSNNRLPFMYSLEESLQAFRLPFPDCSILEGIVSQPMSFSYVPENIPREGIQMGKKKTVNGDIPIRISENSLSRHLYIMGQTGTGKSTMLKIMISECIDKDYGFALIDPHGDLFEEIKKIIPDNKKNKLLIIDTTDPTNSCKHNPLKYDAEDPRSKSLIINELVRIFHELYDMKQAGGPMFEMYFKNGLLLVMDEKVRDTYPNTTLLDFVKVFFDNNYRKELLDLCGNKTLVNFFITAQKLTGEWAFDNFAIYITSKLTRLTDDFYLTPIIAGNDNNIDYRKLIDEGNILLVKMDKGKIGLDNVSMLGRMIISSISLAAMSRADITMQDRKPFYLFIDEFQNFINSDIGSAMSEVRKYGLTLILANQTLGQLNNQVIEGLMGNVGSMVFFRPGINDYDIIKNYLEPDFKKEDVLKLPNFNCIARLLIDNIPSDPFIFQNKHP